MFCKSPDNTKMQLSNQDAELDSEALPKVSSPRVSSVVGSKVKGLCASHKAYSFPPHSSMDVFATGLSLQMILYLLT